MDYEGTPRKNSQKVNVYIILGVLILAILLFLAFRLLFNRESITVSEAINISHEAYVNGDMDSYIRSIDEQVAKLKTNQEKANLYSTRAGDLYNYRLSNNSDKYNSEILNSAYKAESIYPTARTAYQIYLYESEIGSKETAEQYYKLSKDRGIDKEQGAG